MANILKVIFLGVVGFGFLVYLTAPEQPVNNKNQEQNIQKISLSLLPTHFELINNDRYFKKQELFKKDVESYIIVLNHDSLAILNRLHEYTNKNIVLVANVSSTPWFMKKLAVDGKLEDLYKDSKIPLINDTSGDMVKALRLNSIEQTKYFVYKLNKNGIINNIANGDVKLDALEKGVSNSEVSSTLQHITQLLK